MDNESEKMIHDGAMIQHASPSPQSIPSPSPCTHCLTTVSAGRNSTQPYNMFSAHQLMQALPPPVAKELYQQLDESLKEIRLLFIQPGQPLSPITCSLHTFNLTHYSVPSFEALSYEWGLERSSRSMNRAAIILSRCDSEISYRFPVRENLLLALEKVRSSSRRIVLWVDAICVDQSNPQERSHQVGLMSMIYRTARMVHVWLGPEDKENDLPFDLLDRINRELRDLEDQERQRLGNDRELHRANLRLSKEQKVQAEANGWLGAAMLSSVFKTLNPFPFWKTESSSATTPCSEKEKVTEKVDEEMVMKQEDKMIGEAIAAFYTSADRYQIASEYKSLKALLNRSYWTRIWIVQEFVLARRLTLHCGCDSISWDKFAKGLYQIRHFKSSKYAETLTYLWETATNDARHTNESVGAKIALMREKTVAGRQHQLIELFEATKGSKCGDPKDRVFALLGLASDVDEESIAVDYTKSPGAVQADVMRFFRCQPLKKDGKRHDLTYVSSLLIGMLHKY